MLKPTDTEMCIRDSTKAGELTPEWADRLGLPQGIAVAVGALDAHMGAVGASVAPGILDVYKRQGYG